MKKAQLLSLLTFSLWFSSLGQEAVPDSITVEFSNRITSFSADTQSNIFLGFANGSIKKLSSKGEVLDNYSLPNQSPITFIEALNNRKLFLFQRDLQQITVLDRFSSVPTIYRLTDFGLDFIQHTCPVVDGSFWTMENNPSMLKKINPLTNQVLLEVQPQLTDSILHFRSYQNLLYALTRSHLFTFDQFGSEIRSKEILGGSFIQIWKNKLVISETNGYTILEPNTLKQLKRDEFKADKLALLHFDSSIIVIKSTKVHITPTDKKSP